MCLTAISQAVGAFSPNFDAASKASVCMAKTFIAYTGYMIIKLKMHPWFGWICWINWLANSFDALLSKESRYKMILPIGVNFIPNGHWYNDDLPVVL